MDTLDYYIMFSQVIQKQHNHTSVTFKAIPGNDQELTFLKPEPSGFPLPPSRKLKAWVGHFVFLGLVF